MRLTSAVYLLLLGGLLLATSEAHAFEKAIPVRVNIVKDPPAQFQSASVASYRGEIRVAGFVKRGYSESPAAHVDISWLDKEKNVVAEKSTLVLFTGRPSAGFAAPYSASFPAGAVREGETVRVLFRGYPHAFCTKTGIRS